MLLHYVRWVTERPRAVLGAVLVLTAALASQIASLDVDVNPDAQLPQGHPYVSALNEMQEVFGEKNLVFIGLFPKQGDIYEPRFLAKLRALTERIERLPGVVPRTYSSLTLAKSVDIRATMDGMSVKPLLHEDVPSVESARALREAVTANAHYVGTLAAEDGSAAAIIADFDLRPPLSGYAEVHHAVELAIAAEDDGTFDVHLGGPAIYVAWLARYSARMAYFFPLALLIIGLVHYEAFRSWQAMVLPLATALFAMVWSLGLLGLLGIPLDPFNVTTPILILAVAAGHAVQMLKRFYEELPAADNPREAVVRSIVRVGPVMIVASLIAALSFASLATFDTAAIRNFGLFTALGILSALSVEMTLIPAVRSMLPPPSAHERRQEGSPRAFDRLIDSLTTLVLGRRRPLILWAAGCFFLLSVAGSFALRVDSSFRGQFSAGSPVRQDDQALNRAFGGTSTLVLLVTAAVEGAIDEPKLLSALDGIQRWFEMQPGVGKTLSFVDFVKRMHVVMDPEAARAKPIPESRDLVAQYGLLYSISSSPEDFDGFIDRSHTMCLVRVFLREDSTMFAAELIERLQPVLAAAIPSGYRVEITGSLASGYALNEVMVRGKIANILQIGSIILVIAALVFRSFVGGLLVALPLALAAVANFGVMGLTGIPLEIGTATISAMAVGIGADYAIYFLFRLREELGTNERLEEAIRETLRTSGKAILFVSSAIAAGYLTLCFSGFGYHVRLGCLVALTMVVSSVASLTVLPALVLAIRPKFLLGSRARARAEALEGISHA